MLNSKNTFHSFNISLFLVANQWARKNVVWKGKLFSKIQLNTVNPKNRLYALGPEAYLHLHLITKDKTKMDHLDNVIFNEMSVLLPKS